MRNIKKSFYYCLLIAISLTLVSSTPTHTTALAAPAYVDCDPDDADCDGSLDNLDCDDMNPDIYPGAPEIVADGIDQNCDGGDRCYQDLDSDNYGSAIQIDDDNLNCDDASTSFTASTNIDCNDTNSSINPGVKEIPDDNIDQDCNGADATTCYVDNDMDGYGSSSGTIVVAPDGSCDTADGESLNTNDCNDVNTRVYPGAPERCDGLDTNCDGILPPGEIDDDGDGAVECTEDVWNWQGAPLSGYGFEDCNDEDATVYVGASELCDGLDNNCDGNLPTTESDADGDGAVVCIQDSGGWDGSSSIWGFGDCNDTDDNAYPGNTEVLGDGVDQDCDGFETCYTDNDNDGYTPLGSTTLSSDMDCSDSGEGEAWDPTNDCNDENARVYPGAPERCDGLDTNCDGILPPGEIDDDGDGAVECTEDLWNWQGAPLSGYGFEDCNDMNATVYVGASELCDGLDNNCDGNIDEGVQVTFYADMDGDGFGNLGDTTDACTVPTDYETDSTDCDDTDATVYPGAPELCDGKDNNCDGVLPVNESDTDGDGVWACNEKCPNDPTKTDPGICGCGNPDDANDDGVPDCENDCDHNLDVDKDGVPDCEDYCPYDPFKIYPGTCGCGVPDDANDDGVPDCQDYCPDDLEKMEPGICGCGLPDDANDDGVPDCQDYCPDDPEKTEPGTCGCGAPDDANDDGVPDCQDGCDHNVDTDNDGVSDCEDYCSDDPLKIEPGICGCGTADDDNKDGVPDCRDFCPDDPEKTAPGICGCGVSDDANNDGVPDCQDYCPDDPDKTAPGICGCGIQDDANNDGVPDCQADSSLGSEKIILIFGGIIAGVGSLFIFIRNRMSKQ